MNYITLEILKRPYPWALVSLGMLGFQPFLNRRQAESFDPKTKRETIFIRGKYAGDPADLCAIPSVVGVHTGHGINPLFTRVQF